MEETHNCELYDFKDHTMRQRIQDLGNWIAEQYEEHCLDYDQDDVDFRVLYRHCCEIIGSVLTELNDLAEDDDWWQQEPDEDDGQPDDLQENSDFAQDGYFENQECGEYGFWY